METVTEFDALPAIDKEYDHPIVKHAVDSLIAQEMDAFGDHSINDFLAQRTPQLWTSSQIDAISERLNKTREVLSPKVVSDRFSSSSVACPSEVHLASAKIEYLLQENSLMNLEIAEERDSKDAFLAQNAILEEIARQLDGEMQSSNRNISDIQNVRLTLQEKFYPQLCKYSNRRDDALMRRVACENAYLLLAEQLRQRGFDYNQHLLTLEKEREWEEMRKLQDQRVNDTVRQYETVRVEDANDSDAENDTRAAKKLRR